VAVDLESVSGAEVMKTIRHLDSIGVRFAGTKTEQAAADWIEAKYRQLGLRNVHQQEFPCLSFSYSECRTEVLTSAGWSSLNSEPAAHSPSTPGDGIEGELLVVEKVPSSLATARRKMKGRIVLIYNSEFFQFPVFKRVMQSGPSALLVVDDRFPNDWTVAVGFPRYWVDFLSCPIVNVPHSEAWKSVREAGSGVRLKVRTSIKPGTSQNVIGEVAGSEFPNQVLVISGHHDTVINSSGVDDNATGVAAVLELARVFTGTSPRRTLRFISYGTEEQLSEGAKFYALEAEDLERIQFVLNVDSIGAVLGKTGIYYCGPSEIEKTLKPINEALGFEAHLIRELSPFSDHFPLNCCGIPAVWYYRTTYVAARHYHHSVHENLDILSPGVLERTIRQQAVFLDCLANSDQCPVPRRIPKNQMNVLRKWAREWCGVDSFER
jgi:hypothetical protein